LIALGSLDLGDCFRFVTTFDEVRQERPGRDRSQLATVNVEGFVGTRSKFVFTVDMVVGSVITAEPERRAPEPMVEIAGLVAPSFRLYPIVDHIADKLCATFEQFGVRRTPSTRVRDLVDLVVIARTESVDISALRCAIEAERLHRGLPPVTEFGTPPGWRTSYPAAARGVADCVDVPRHADAVELVRRFLDSVLSGELTAGVWHPDRLAWGAEPFTRRRGVGGWT
jgi:hypothetical protein